MTSHALLRTLAVLSFALALSSSPARAQAPSVVVVPWSVGESDAASMRSAAEAASLEIPSSVGTVVSVAETRTRFETEGSSDAPSVTSAELEQWTAYSRQAVRDLANEDYAAAREALRHAQEISDRAAAEMSREEARARQVLDTCLFGVRAYIEQQDPHATEQMLGCRRLVPRIAPSPNIHTPEVVELLERVDTRLTTAHRGPLVIESQPAACTVRLNGVTVGQSPFTSEQLAPGEYRVQVECGEGGHGRLHRVSVDDTSGPVTLRVDARFDRVVRTDGALRLSYADASDAEAHRLADAREIGRVLGATEVWLVGVSADGTLSGDRVRVEDGADVASTTAAAGSAALVAALSAAPVAQSGGGGSDLQPAGWAILGVGGAVAIAGAVMLAVGAGDLDATSAPRDGETFAAAQSRQSTGETLTGAGGALLGVGVIAAGVGLGLALSSGGSGGEHATLRLGPFGAELQMRF